MPKLALSTVVTHPGTGVPVVLHAGDEVPEWAAGMVGDHVLDKPKPAPRRKEG